ncbi:hypothetical protein OL548_20995 [Lysinibacillus sp. MHQ-1]|nr:hypothetical protein OL548_20995 [Lysinibacillus sp. MHQ-1]
MQSSSSFFLATRPVDGVDVAKSSAGESESKGNVLVVQTTTKELESISKKIFKGCSKRLAFTT